MAEDRPDWRQRLVWFAALYAAGAAAAILMAYSLRTLLFLH
jgi:hypothetical protein